MRQHEENWVFDLLPDHQIARLLMSDIKALPETERTFVVQLLQNASGLTDAIVIAKRLNRLLRRDSQENLDQVLDAAAGTALAEFAAGLRRDSAAVQAVLEQPWTTSPAEGQINRIKLSSGRCMAEPASSSSAGAGPTRPMRSQRQHGKCARTRIQPVLTAFTAHIAFAAILSGVEALITSMPVHDIANQSYSN